MIGTHGTAMLAGTELKVQFHDGKTLEMAPDRSAGGTGADPMAFPHDYHRAVLGDFLDAIEQRREPMVNGREALRVHRLIDALLAAGESDGKVRVARG
jgi:predicted dehydrogenase